MLSTIDVESHDAQPYLYRAYGLTIASDLRLPELPCSADDRLPRISIRLTAVPPQLTGPASITRVFQLAQDRLLLEADGVARYLASDGTKISVEVFPGAEEDSVQLFLLGSVFGALLHQRGVLPLHASAIETPRGAVIFAGRPGTGKSALAAAFHKRGYKVIADEMCVIEAASSSPRAIPSFPRLLLLDDVIEDLNLRADARPARPNLAKYWVPLGNGFRNSSSDIHRIYTLSVTNRDRLGIARIGGPRAVRELTEHTFRRSWLKGMRSLEDHFLQVASLAREVPVSLFERPFGLSGLAESADILERDFSQ